MTVDRGCSGSGTFHGITEDAKGVARRRTRGVFAILPTALTAVAMLAASPAAALGQVGELATRCLGAVGPTVGVNPFGGYCRLIAQAIESSLAPIGLAPAAGNPVPGTASTVGLRLGALPRVSGTVRLNAVRAEFLDLRDLDQPRVTNAWVPALALDGALGLFEGASPAPGIRGMGSLDLLASLGLAFLPDGPGFRNGTRLAWGLGGRVGVLRETFTAPGASVSMMYRRLGRFSYGDAALDRSDVHFEADISDVSARAAVGKRLLGLGATAGLGWDRYRSDLRFEFEPGMPFTVGPVAVDGYTSSRFSGFVNASYTFLILHLVAEAGLQQGADPVPSGLPASLRAPTGSNFFGSLAVRLAI